MDIYFKLLRCIIFKLAVKCMIGRRINIEIEPFIPLLKSAPKGKETVMLYVICGL